MVSYFNILLLPGPSWNETYPIISCSNKHVPEVVKEMEPLDKTEEPLLVPELRGSTQLTTLPCAENLTQSKDAIQCDIRSGGEVSSDLETDSPNNDLSYNPDDVIPFDGPSNKTNFDNLSPSTDCKFEFPRRQLKVISKIGEGNFGEVWKYEATEGFPTFSSNTLPMTVAVKTLKRNVPIDHKWDLLNEISIMTMLDPHPNVVRLLGCCREKGMQ